MKIAIGQIIPLIFLMAFSSQSMSQEPNYTFEDFVGTWHGTISSQSFGGYNDQITMNIEPDGFYTETSGRLMPSIYPNTQQCEFDAPTTRFHWWYLQTVYAGQYFYQHFFYEIVYFSNDTLEMHYNYWDDPEPHPEVGTIFIVRENQTPPPVALEYNLSNEGVVLEWDAPSNGGGSVSGIQGYNIYKKFENNVFELIDFTGETLYNLEEGNSAGTYTYYVTALYAAGESDPSNQVSITFTAPAPAQLEGYANGNNIELSWTEPEGGLNPVADLLGYNIYHKDENNSFELLDFVESADYLHENIAIYGTHTYYVTAVYEGGESNPSNLIELQLIISGISNEQSFNTSVYPNPAVDKIHVKADKFIRTIRIVNQSGQLLNSFVIGAKDHTININNLSKGLYVLVIETDEGISTRRVFVN